MRTKGSKNKIKISPKIVVEQLEEVVNMSELDAEIIDLDSILDAEEETPAERIESLQAGREQIEKIQGIKTELKKEYVREFNKNISVAEVEKDIVDTKGCVNFEIFKRVYLQQQEIQCSFIDFSEKFRYWLTMQNIETSNLTQRNIYKFINYMPNLKVDELFEGQKLEDL